MPVIALRPVVDDDLGPLFDQSRDPESVWMAAFTPDDPDDRTAFDAHMARVRSLPDVIMRAVTCDNDLVGSIAAFDLDGRTEVTYWIDGQPGDAASRAGPWNCSWTWSPPGRCTPARPATTQARSGSSRNRASRSSEPRTPSPPAGTATSRKPSCGRTRHQAHRCPGRFGGSAAWMRRLDAAQNHLTS